VRENPLIGYGLVIGLNGTGDAGGEITNSSLKRMFQKLGLNPKQELSSKNVAAVIVTAKLPPFARQGQKVDVQVSSIGDANSLAGGTLLITPLKGGDGEIYVVANGSLSIGGLKSGSKFPTAGRIVNGGLIEKEIPDEFNQKKSLRMSLNYPDFTTSARIEKTINSGLGGKYASARDSGTIDIIIPPLYERKIVQFIATVENFSLEIDQLAKIVINEKTGTIVAGGDIVLKPTAISHGNLIIQVGNKDKPDEKENKSHSIYHMKSTNKLKDLVEGLNALGTAPEDLISIFQNLKKSGALIGEIEFI